MAKFKTLADRKPNLDEETLQAIEREIDQKVATEKGLFPDTPLSEERLVEIRAEVEDQYLASAEGKRELARNNETEREPIPYLESFDDAMDHFGGADGVTTIDDYPKLDDKAELIGVPFMIVKFWFSEGEMGTYVTMKVLTKDNRKFTVVDGSTGVCAQLEETARVTGRNGGVMARDGLRVSEYTYRGQPAKTFYLT